MKIIGIETKLFYLSIHQENYQFISIIKYQYAEYILEYIHENYLPHFFSTDNYHKVEIRRLLHWINFKFYREVTKYILDEKIIRILSNAGSPRSNYIRIAKENFYKHIQYFSNLIEQREYVATDKLTLADFALAAHISILDFFNEIQWFDVPTLKHWYSLIKSRPSFRPLLNDRFPGFNPPAHYLELDF